MSSAEKKITDDLRALAKLPSNKPCFDCGLGGPQANAVLAPYNIFVCQTCAGLHRSMNHKVKGISMSKFSPEEVEALRAGGNKKAKAVWLAKYDESKMPPIKPTETQKIKEKMDKCFEKKEWYDENGRVKKAKTSSATKTKKVSKKDSSASTGGDEEETKAAAPKPKKAVVSSANVVDDLLAFDAPAPVKEEDPDNPFESEEEEPEEEEVADNPFSSAPAATAPASNGKKAVAPASTGGAALPIFGATSTAAPASTTSSPEKESVDLLIRTLKDIGVKHKFPRDKMLQLVDEALSKVGLKAAVAAPAVSVPASTPAPAPVAAKPAAQEVDLFAEAEKRTVMSNPTSPLLNPLNPSLAAKPAPSSAGAPLYPGNAPSPGGNPFEEDDNPFATSPTKPVYPVPANPAGVGAAPVNPYPGGFYPTPFGAAPPMAANPFGPAPTGYPGYPAGPAAANPFGAPAAAGPFNPYPAPAFAQPQPVAQPAAQPAAQPPKPKDDLFSGFVSFN